MDAVNATVGVIAEQQLEALRPDVEPGCMDGTALDLAADSRRRQSAIVRALGILCDSPLWNFDGATPVTLSPTRRRFTK